MSYLSLLFASNTPGLSSAAREIRQPQAEIRIDEDNFGSLSSGGDVKQGLPSGVASMEHWLDLNA